MSGEGLLELWIGNVEFRPLPGSSILGESAGAFSNVVTWARNSDDFREKAAELAALYLLFVNEVEGEEPVTIRKERTTVEESIEEQIAAAEEHPKAILFGTLHKYKFDSA